MHHMHPCLLTFNINVSYAICCTDFDFVKGDFEVAHSSPRSCDSKLGLGSGSIVQRAFQPEHVQAEGQSILHFFNLLFPSSSRQNLSKFWGAKFCDIFLSILCMFTKPGSYGGFAKGSFPVKLAKTSFRTVCRVLMRHVPVPWKSI